jgi:hypothetical protein
MIYIGKKSQKMLQALRKIVDETNGIIVCNFLIFMTDSSDNVMFVYLVIVINLIKLLSQFQ